MLFVQSKRLSVPALEGAAARLALLDRLQASGLTPLIRSARLHAYELALTGPDKARELEQAVAAGADEENTDAPYVRGDVFCFEDFVLFLILSGDGRADALRAGIVYPGDTAEPRRKLDSFCRSVREEVLSLSATHPVAAHGATSGNGAGGNGNELAEGRDAHVAGARENANSEWVEGGGSAAEALARFATAEVGATSADLQSGHSGGGARSLTGEERARVVSLLEDAGARRLLRGLIEAHAEGRTSNTAAPAKNAAAGEGESPATQSLLSGLVGGGLVRREVAVSCRQQGRALFRLPSMEAFEMITASGAVCSECGSTLADERAEELVTPTELASALLRDASWMTGRLRTVLREEHGLPEAEFAARAGHVEGESLALANVCGELFLFYLRDGEVSAADARRAVEAEAEAGATHLVVVAANGVQDEARARLREHARRRARAGVGASEVLVVEGLENLVAELRPAFERVSRRVLAGELYELDESLGVSVGQLVAARFRLMQRPGALRDLAASAAATLSGSLREM